MKTWQRNNLVIYNEDFLKTHLKDEVIDLIVTSPPYNVGIDYSQYKDSDSYADYIEFSKKMVYSSIQGFKKGWENVSKHTSR